MRHTLGYADAARLLGGGESPLVNALDKATGGPMLGLSIALPGVLSLSDAKTDFIRLSHDFECERVVLDRLATDNEVPPAFAAGLLQRLMSTRVIIFETELPSQLTSCLLALLGRDVETDPFLRAVFAGGVDGLRAESDDPHLTVEAIVRFRERDLARRWAALNIEAAPS
jgi:hypothetical protein